MNSKKTNEKIIKALSEMEPIPDLTSDERDKRDEEAKKAIDDATKEAPLAFARKVAGILCIALWAFSLVSILFGFGALGAMIPFMLIALGVYCGLNVPMFFQKGKTFDIVISIIATAVCFIIAVSLLVSYRPY